MSTRTVARRVQILTVPLLIAAAVGWPAPIGSAELAESFTIRGILGGVTAISARSAWAVGVADRGLILRWDGTAWQRVPAPSAARHSILYAVAFTSARSGWAVGP